MIFTISCDLMKHLRVTLFMVTRSFCYGMIATSWAPLKCSGWRYVNKSELGSMMVLRGQLLIITIISIIDIDIYHIK